MRAWRPEIFSDSKQENVQKLSKAVFEYHLETLTSRKQEYEFEHFCRKLCEKELCPNLRVQTGPTGGGDSKVDAETYPVASTIAERWWMGSPSAGAERWAFAFSAKQDWKSKVKADVENIISTGRSYALIYFISNQFCRDKDRADKEDSLSKLARIPVRILDRSWIVDKVYSNSHLNIAIDTLRIEGTQQQEVRKLGSRDTARLSELEELDSQVADSSRYDGARYQLVEDCLRTAILARGLERPRSEVESRFAHVDRLAQQLNYTKQRLRIAYNRAWTAFWWYEDANDFNRFYDEVEAHAAGSIHACDLELLQNLWLLLVGAAGLKQLQADSGKIDERRLRLVAMLEPLAADPLRLNNALEARTGLTLVRITTARQDQDVDELELCWQALSAILDEARCLGDYPVAHLLDLFTRIGEMVESPGFDAVYEKLVDITRKLRSDGEAGEAYSQRAFQKLKQGKPYDAIRWFGRAEELLLKHEYRDELVLALLGGSDAFTQVGLIWAARNKALAAVERALAKLNEQGDVTPPTLMAVQRLVWAELRLGRIPHVIDAMNLEATIAAALGLEGEGARAYADWRRNQEAVLGIYLLKLPATSLFAVSRLVDGLERAGIPLAAMALLYSLGHKQALRDEGYCPATEDDGAIDSLFQAWMKQPAASEIASQPLLLADATTIFGSVILGCAIFVEVPNTAVSVGIAESLLGSLEAFLSTSDETDLMPHCEEMRVIILASPRVSGVPQNRISDEAAYPQLEITHPVDYEFNTAADIQAYCDWLRHTIVQILTRIAVVHDVKAWLEKVAGEERGFSWALSLGNTMTLNHNVFGPQTPIGIERHIPAGARSFTPLRTEPLRPAVKAPETTDRLEFGTGAPPDDLRDPETMKHSDRRVLSPIDIDLWDRAGWQGIMYLSCPAPYTEPPILALTFKDADAAKAIFRQWRERWGAQGSDNDLRLAIITGLTRRYPATYTVVVGPCQSLAAFKQSKTVFIISRMLRMEPATGENLERFLAAYRRAGCYVFAPAHRIGADQPPSLFTELAIRRQQLDVRPAWQIGDNDPDASVLNDDDEPIIPDGEVNPPVYQALARMRAMRKARERRQ